MSGINISLVANVRDFIKGTKDSSDALEDVVGSLEDVASEADTTERKASSAVGDIAKDGEKAADKLDRSFRDAFDSVKKDSQDGARHVAKNTKEGFDDAGDAAKTFKEDATNEFAAFASSADGSVQGVLDGIQGLTGGLAASMGPAGAAVAAAGAGAAVVAAEWTKHTENIKARVSAMVDDLIESGDRLLSSEYLQQAIRDIVTGSEDAVVSLQEVKRISSITGAPEQTVLRAAAGDAKSLNEIMPLVQQNLDSARKSAGDYFAATGGNGGHQTDALREQVGLWESVDDTLSGLVDNTNAARGQAEMYNAAITSIARDRIISKEADAFEMLTGKVAGTTKAIQDMPSSKSVTITADTSGLDSAITSWTASRRPVKIAAEFVTRDGKQVY